MGHTPKNSSDASAPDVRTQIVWAATHHFAAAGFDGTSLQVVADDVGVAKASLLYHFPSKDDLRLAVLDGVMSHWNEVLPRLLHAATSGERRFDSLIDEIVGFFTDDRDRARLLVREMLDRPDEMKALFEEYLGPWMTILSDYIRNGQGREIIDRGVDPEAYILQIIQLVVGTVAIGEVVESLLDERPDDRALGDRQLDESIRIARSGLFVDPEALSNTE